MYHQPPKDKIPAHAFILALPRAVPPPLTMYCVPLSPLIPKNAGDYGCQPATHNIHTRLASIFTESHHQRHPATLVVLMSNESYRS